jgi:integrase
MNLQQLEGKLDTYFALRSAVGFKDTARKAMLHDFIEYVAARHMSGPIHAHLAVDWASVASASRGAAGQASRLNAARRFLEYLRADDPEIEIPGCGLLAPVRRRTPYLFTPEEIVRLIEAAASIQPRRSLRPHTYTTAIGLMCSTGMRVGEVVRLKVGDVDLETSLPNIRIRESKFRKSRIVPLHTSVAEKLQHYVELRNRMEYAGVSDAFFVSNIGTPLNTHTLWVWFIRMTRRLGMFPSHDGRTPTLHCLRHYFAIQRLTLWCQEGMPIRDWMPNISVYLGHVRPRDTYWYLTATPTLLLAAAESFQRYREQGEHDEDIAHINRSPAAELLC